MKTIHPISKILIMSIIALIAIPAPSASIAQDTELAPPDAAFINVSEAFNQLNPDSPQTYRMLGEVLIAQASSPEEKQVARQTLALGVALAERMGASQLAASMCITLAAYEDDADRAATLWDLALISDPQRISAWKQYRNLARAQEQQARENAIRCLHAARFFKPERAEQLLARPEVRIQIIAAARRASLDPDSIIQSINNLIKQGFDDPCDGRIFIVQRGKGVITRELCTDHARPIGTANSDQELKDFIKLETNLHTQLSDQHRPQPWANAAYLQLDAPLQEPSISMILNDYQADLSKPYRKGGRWVSAR